MLVPCSSSDARMLLINANFSACKLIIDCKFCRKGQYPFFIVNVFFLKQVISAIMISVNLHYFSSIHCLLAFSTNQFITHWRLKRRKTYERLVLSFYIVSFVLNVIVFVRNGLKQTKPNHLFQIPFFHRNLIYVYFKKNVLRRMWRDLGI